MPENTHPYSEDQDLLTASELGSLAKISRSTIARAIKAQRITPLRTPGGHLRFRRSDVKALLTGEASA